MGTPGSRNSGLFKGGQNGKKASHGRACLSASSRQPWATHALNRTPSMGHETSPMEASMLNQWKCREVQVDVLLVDALHKVCVFR